MEKGTKVRTVYPVSSGERNDDGTIKMESETVQGTVTVAAGDVVVIRPDKRLTVEVDPRHSAIILHDRLVRHRDDIRVGPSATTRVS